MVDNNLFLSGASLLDMSEGGAYVHNLFNGTLVSAPEPNRETPYHPAHATALAGLSSVKGGDDRFYNNLFVGRSGTDSQKVTGFGLSVYDQRAYPLQTGGNVYYHGAQPYGWESGAVVSAADPQVKLVQQGDRFILRLEIGPELKQAKTALITTQALGKARISGLPYENSDGTPIALTRDFLGRKRNPSHPTPGPFEHLGTGPQELSLGQMTSP